MQPDCRQRIRAHKFRGTFHVCKTLVNNKQTNIQAWYSHSHNFTSAVRIECGVYVCVTQKWNDKIHIQFQSSTQTQRYSNRYDGVINNCRYFSLFQMRLINIVIEIACSSCCIVPIFKILEMHAESSASIYFLISFHPSRICTIFCYEIFLFVFNSL